MLVVWSNCLSVGLGGVHRCRCEIKRTRLPGFSFSHFAFRFELEFPLTKSNFDVTSSALWLPEGRLVQFGIPAHCVSACGGGQEWVPATRSLQMHLLNGLPQDPPRLTLFILLIWLNDFFYEFEWISFILSLVKVSRSAFYFRSAVFLRIQFLQMIIRSL